MADGGGLASVLAGAQIAAEKATDDAEALTLARSTAFHALSLILRALQAAMESDAMEREPRGPSWTEAVRAALEDAITSKALASTVGRRLIDCMVGWDGSQLRGSGWLAAGGGWSSGHADTTPNPSRLRLRCAHGCASASSRALRFQPWLTISTAR